MPGQCSICGQRFTHMVCPKPLCQQIMLNMAGGGQATPGQQRLPPPQPEERPGNAILRVHGAGSSFVNGLYEMNGEFCGRPQYRKVNTMTPRGIYITITTRHFHDYLSGSLQLIYTKLFNIITDQQTRGCTFTQRI